MKRGSQGQPHLALLGWMKRAVVDAEVTYVRRLPCFLVVGLASEEGAGETDIHVETNMTRQDQVTVLRDLLRKLEGGGGAS